MFISHYIFKLKLSIIVMIVDTDNINEARNKILKINREHPQEEIIVISKDDNYNRKILEMKEVDVLLLKIHNRKDALKQRNSGLNEVLCKIANGNNIKIGIEIDELKKLGKKEKALALSRISQNIFLCKKIGCQIVVYPNNKHKKQDVMSLFLILGSDTKLAKKSV